MRMVRTIAATFAGMMLVPAVAFAQTSGTAAPSRDAWYWGVNGGAMMFNAGFAQEQSVTAPTVGGEWFIMRQRFALRVSVMQAFFEKQASVYDTTVAGFARPVDVKDWRRYAVEVYALPSGNGVIVPYAGGGLALNVLQNSTPVGPFVDQESADEVFTDVDESSTRASFVWTVGLQMNFGNAALFGQASAMPTRNAFILNRSQYTTVFEGGIRYSFGSAIEKF
jgi:opacity protein-like surface antigen